MEEKKNVLKCHKSHDPWITTIKCTAFSLAPRSTIAFSVLGNVSSGFHPTERNCFFILFMWNVVSNSLSNLIIWRMKNGRSVGSHTTNPAKLWMKLISCKNTFVTQSLIHVNLKYYWIHFSHLISDAGLRRLFRTKMKIISIRKHTWILSN